MSHYQTYPDDTTNDFVAGDMATEILVECTVPVLEQDDYLRLKHILTERLEMCQRTNAPFIDTDGIDNVRDITDTFADLRYAGLYPIATGRTMVYELPSRRTVYLPTFRLVNLSGRLSTGQVSTVETDSKLIPFSPSDLSADFETKDSHYHYTKTEYGIGLDISDGEGVWIRLLVDPKDTATAAIGYFDDRYPDKITYLLDSEVVLKHSVPNNQMYHLASEVLMVLGLTFGHSGYEKPFDFTTLLPCTYTVKGRYDNGKLYLQRVRGGRYRLTLSPLESDGDWSDVARTLTMLCWNQHPSRLAEHMEKEETRSRKGPTPFFVSDITEESLEIEYGRMLMVGGYTLMSRDTAMRVIDIMRVHDPDNTDVIDNTGPYASKKWMWVRNREETVNEDGSTHSIRWLIDPIVEVITPSVFAAGVLWDLVEEFYTSPPELKFHELKGLPL